MQKFEILPHTADLRLKVTSDNVGGIFKSALEGMSNIVRNNCFEDDSDLNLAENINIDSIDESMLLIDFLSEILTISHNNKAVYRIKEIKKLTPNSISADIEGKKLDGFDEDIKAVTYSEAKIVKNSSGMYEIIIVFDI
jgi:SHS2 domain-containing protein